MPIDPNNLADWIIADHCRRGEVITNLRLQKLLFYVQAWHLALTGEALIGEDFEAWVHGPVLRSQYDRFKKRGSSPLDISDCNKTSDPDEIELPAVPGEVANHLKEVMEVYGPFNTWKLEQMTHDELPWREARGGIPADAPSNNVITKQSMKDFYRELANG